MILVLAGTLDGRQLAEKLGRLGQKVLAAVISEYGENLAKGDYVTVITGKLTTDDMLKIIKDKKISLIADASHPYAVNASKNALAAAKLTGVTYVRYEREATKLPSYEKLHLVKDALCAAKIAAKLGKVIFLTTGSRDLEKFKNEPSLLTHRLIARVLPEAKVMEECARIGFAPKDIVAMQGPFSRDLNMALFKEFNAEVVITKNSGSIGGLDTKIEAAIALNIFLVVIDRPKICYENVYNSESEIIAFCLKNIKETD